MDLEEKQKVKTVFDRIENAQDVYYNEIYTQMILLSNLSTRARNILKRHFPTYSSFLELEDYPSKMEDIKSCGVKTREELLSFLPVLKKEIIKKSSNTEAEIIMASKSIGQRFPFLSEEEILFVCKYKENECCLPALYIIIRFLKTTDNRDLQIWSSEWGIIHQATKTLKKCLSRERIRQILLKVEENIQKVIYDVIKEEEWDEYGLEFFFSFSCDKLNKIFKKEQIENRYLGFYLLSIGTKSDLFVFTREGEQLHLNTIRYKSRHQLFLDNIEENAPSYLQKKLNPFIFACSKIYSGFYFGLYFQAIFHIIAGEFDFDICSPIRNCINSDDFWESSTSKDNVVNYKYERTELYRALKTIAIEIGGKDFVVKGNLFCRAKKINYSRFVYETLMEENKKLSSSNLYLKFLSRFPDKQISKETFSAKIRDIANEGKNIIHNWVVDIFTDNLPGVDNNAFLKELPLFEVVKIKTPTGLYYNLYALKKWNDPIVDYILNYVRHNNGRFERFVEHLCSHYPNFNDKDVIYYLTVCQQRGVLYIDIDSVSKQKWDDLWFNKFGIL